MAPEEAAAVATLRNPQRPNPEELVARAIAPVKPEYLRPPPIRPCASDPPAEDESNVNNNGNASVERNGVKAAGSNPAVSLGKKSKRQLKRERKEEQKSVGHLCPEVAKTGDVKACKFGGGCRFSHDLDGFLQQKPVDLPGTCPFIAVEEPCPYGVACRFFGTHGEHPAPASGGLSASRKKSEVNGLSKNLQRLLWKNKVRFQKADAQLKLLGLTVGKNLKKNEEVERADANADNSKEDGGVELEPCLAENEEGPTNTCQRENSVEDAFDESESRPPKKSKLPMEEEFSDKEIEHDEIPTDINKVESETSVREDLNADFEKDNPVDDTHASRVEIVPKLNIREKKLIDFRGKLYLAPLTTVGNLPFRRVCKVLGADITCGEMAMCTNLLQGQASEWALLRRHSSEDLFGVQICGAYPDTVSRTVELIDRECDVDFVDINMGCPIDIVVNKGAGSSLLTKPMRMKNIIQAACGTIDKPLTVKVRTGYFEGRNRIDSLIADISHCGASAITIHGRSRQQRYSKLADWDYVYQCARKAPDELQVLGNGDIFSYVDWNKHTSDCPKLSTCMIARAALVKPWIFTEIKEQRHWDITSGERLDILKKYANFGLQHWGSDSKGVETTRHFLLEWLSYTYRYIPVGLLDVIPQRLNWRPPSYFGRDDLETLMASDSAADWIRISEMLLGKVPEGFTFAPKHKSNAYDRAENG